MDPGRLQEYAQGYDLRRRLRAEAGPSLGTVQAFLPRLVEMCRAFGARRVRLFGSVARRAEVVRDLDVAVEGVPPARFFDLYGAVLRESPLMVDLVDIEDCPAGLRETIDREGGDLWACSDRI